MNPDFAGQAGAFLRRSAAALEAASADPKLEDTIVRIADAIATSLRDGGKLLLAGNGGSAADAQHLAAEFLSRFVSERQPLAAIALTTDTSVLTAIGNDYGFDCVFERQIRGLGRAGDVFIAISTSGRSKNILSALSTARQRGLLTIGFTGAQSAEMAALCDCCLCAPSSETAIIQQIHIVAGHAICALVERMLGVS
ncbi:MAG: D-sedoheptulose 7-phosphate isomerase [Hyphomicrobiales bacterium]|nr:D-sedoheptulose 7-phosphate isomerase [Hyphomicrobiales bacterium]